MFRDVCKTADHFERRLPDAEFIPGGSVSQIYDCRPPQRTKIKFRTKPSRQKIRWENISQCVANHGMPELPQYGNGKEMAAYYPLPLMAVQSGLGLGIKGTPSPFAPRPYWLSDGEKKTAERSGSFPTMPIKAKNTALSKQETGTRQTLWRSWPIAA